MSSKRYASPLVLRPGPPWRLAVLVGGACLGALSLLLLAPLPDPVAWAGGLWLLVWAGVTWRRYFGPGRVVEAVWKEEGEWVLRQGSGRELTGRLAPDTFFRPWLVVLNFRTGRAVPALILFSGEPDAQTHRRLRVRLRLYQARLEEEEAESRLSARAAGLFSGRRSWEE